VTALHKNNVSGHRSHDRIVGGFTSTYAISAYLFTVRSVSLFPEHGEVYSIHKDSKTHDCQKQQEETVKCYLNTRVIQI
jgi:hypothetical protein